MALSHRYRAILSASERSIPAAAVWQTYSHADCDSSGSATSGSDSSGGGTDDAYQYHLLGVDVKNTSALPVLRSDFYPEIDPGTPAQYKSYTSISLSILSLSLSLSLSL
jgi:hypothetical protein